MRSNIVYHVKVNIQTNRFCDTKTYCPTIAYQLSHHEINNWSCWNYRISILAQTKLKKRNIYKLMEELTRRFALSRETIRAAILFWKECSDISLRRRQLTNIESMVKQIGHGDIKSLFS